MSEKNRIRNRDSTYGGFLSSYEYEAEIAKREKASKKTSMQMMLALAVSLLIVVSIFVSFIIAAEKNSAGHEERVPVSEAEQEQSIPKRTSSAFPTAVYCISKTGFYGSPISEDYSQKYNIPRGVKITVLTGAAEYDGLLKDDIVVSLNGTAVHSVDEIVKLVNGLENGSDLSLVYFRKGEYYSLVSSLK